MAESALINSWREHLVGPVPGLHLTDSVHPLQFFIGKTDDDAPRVVIRSVDKPVKPTLSDVVSVERYEEQSGKWNLSLTLRDNKFSEVFLRLTDDMYARSSDAPNPRVALDRVAAVLEEWRRLLEPRPLGLLTMDELRGLIGELWLIDIEFSAERTIEAAIEGWLGPLGLPQDFWYAEGGFYEAKSIGPATVRVKVSSEHQLDAADLELRVIVIGSTDESSPGAVNLPALVNRIKSKLAAVAVSADTFDERLDRLGVDLSESFYSEAWFVVSRMTVYEVDGRFPAIRASSLAVGVERVNYELQLAAIEEFRVRSVEVS